MTQTPWLYETASTSTLDIPVRWSVITYPDPGDELYPEPDPEDEAA